MSLGLYSWSHTRSYNSFQCRSLQDHKSTYCSLQGHYSSLEGLPTSVALFNAYCQPEKDLFSGRFLDRSQHYDDDMATVSENSQGTENTVKVENDWQIRTNQHSELLPALQMACQTNGIYKGAIILRLDFSMDEPARVAFNACICIFSSCCITQKDKLTLYCCVGKYLLMLHATCCVIEVVEIGIINFNRPGTRVLSDTFMPSEVKTYHLVQTIKSTLWEVNSSKD